MIWLIGQMWVLLLSAFLIGLAVGWWIWGAGRRRREAAPGAQNGDANAADVPARAPELLDRPLHGPKDDLTQIIGLDAPTEARLNALGVFYLRQIAGWDGPCVRWIEEQLEAPGRIDREHWVEQARTALG